LGHYWAEDRIWPQVEGFGDIDGNGQTDVLEFWQYHGAKEFYCVHNFLSDEPETTDYFANFRGSDYVPHWSRIIPDINGDGCDELIVSWYYDIEYDFIWHFYLGGEEPDTESDFDFAEIQGGIRETNNIGDVNGDGWGDLAFSMTAYEGAYWAYIFLGGPDFDDQPEAMIVSPFEGVRYDNGLGASVKGIGDFNGNGVGDMLVLSQPDNSDMQAVIVMALDAEFAKVKDGGKSESLPRGFNLYPPYPNPFNNQVEIAFELNRPSYATISIFGIDGKLIHAIGYPDLTPGIHRLFWDGTDSAQARISTGLYFIELTTPYGSTRRSVVMLR